MTERRPQPSRQTFRRKRRLLDDFFLVDEFIGEFERYDGKMTAEQRLLVFERGDSVAALLFDPFHKEIILVEQFRLPTVGKGQGAGWLLEPAAGILKDTETVEACTLREIKEETGYQVSSLVPISTFFLSPGGSTERIHLYFAEVRRTQQTEQGGGVPGDGENIRIVRMPLAEFFTMLRNREFEDAKLIIAGHWLKDRLAAISTSSAAISRRVVRRLKLPPRRSWFFFETKPEKFVGYIAGDIRDVEGIDVWVDPLTSYMLLDKFTDRTVSAAIRAAGAEKFPSGKQIKADLIGDHLRSEMSGLVYVSPGKVICTTAGMLNNSRNRVKQILHVSTTHGEFGEPPRVEIQTIEQCIDNVLAHVARENRYSSVLFPMIGTGEGALTVKVVAPKLLERAIKFLKENPDAKLSRIFLLAYSEIDVDEVARAFDGHAPDFEPENPNDLPGSSGRNAMAQPATADGARAPSTPASPAP